MSDAHDIHIHLTAFAYELGEETHDLDELTTVLPGVRNSLRQAGLASYRISTKSPVELARGPIERSLAALDPGAREGLRRVVFATNSLAHPSLATPHALSRLLAELGLPSLFPIGVFMSFCANFQAALELARALVVSGRERDVLVVCTDVFDKGPDRLVSPKISVHSDAAVSLVVSASDGPFRLLETRLRVDSAMGALDRNTQFVQYMDGVSRAVVGIVDETLGAAGLGRDQIVRVLPNNYNAWVCRSMAQLAGFGEAQLYLDNLPRFAHALAADNPINLVDCVAAGKAASGDHLVLLGSGAFQWGCSVVRVA
jgi:3-oxoacyl-[acyl-carrier-protein] synthase III